MAVYRFAICDNEPSETDYLRGIVGHWAALNQCIAQISCFPSAEAFLFDYASEKDYDILLLDIEMGAMSGVDLARSIRQENKEAQIIFVTGYMEYIIDGYEVEALHYLLKPVTEEKLCSVLDRAAAKIRRNERVLILDASSERVRVPLCEIRYLEVNRNYVTVHAKETYTLKATLSELEKQLDSRFFRTGRSFIINLHSIRRITRTTVFLLDGATLPLPRSQYDAIHRALIDRL